MDKRIIIMGLVMVLLLVIWLENPRVEEQKIEEISNESWVANCIKEHYIQNKVDGISLNITEECCVEYWTNYCNGIQTVLDSKVICNIRQINKTCISNPNTESMIFRNYKIYDPEQNQWII